MLQSVSSRFKMIFFAFRSCPKQRTPSISQSFGQSCSFTPRTSTVVTMYVQVLLTVQAVASPAAQPGAVSPCHPAGLRGYLQALDFI